MKVVGICQIYNEIEKGNLERYLENVSKLCDDIIILDDSSTDNPDELIYKYTNNLYATEENNGLKKLQTLSKSFLLSKARELNADWVLTLDADEVLEPKFTREVLEKEIKDAEEKGINSLGFIWTHLWLSRYWYRVDNGLNPVSPPRLYKNLPGEIRVIPYMHQPLWPQYAANPTQLSYRIMHYGSSSVKLLIDKMIFYCKTENRLTPDKHECSESNKWLVNEGDAYRCTKCNKKVAAVKHTALSLKEAYLYSVIKDVEIKKVLPEWISLDNKTSEMEDINLDGLHEQVIDAVEREIK